MMIEYQTLRIDTNSKQCSIDRKIIPLTKKEYELLVLLITNPDYVYSREEILERLWKNSVSLRTVDTTVSRLRKKLGKYSENLQTRIGFGYSFRTENLLNEGRTE